MHVRPHTVINSNIVAQDRHLGSHEHTGRNAENVENLTISRWSVDPMETTLELAGQKGS